MNGFMRFFVGFLYWFFWYIFYFIDNNLIIPLTLIDGNDIISILFK